RFQVAFLGGHFRCIKPHETFLFRPPPSTEKTYRPPPRFSHASFDPHPWCWYSITHTVPGVGCSNKVGRMMW
ncbi:hypothetical protein B0T21DRAFT_358575, partial [Apiosordaria backusii]